MIYMIYAPNERTLAQTLADRLAALDSKLEFGFAPVGLMAGSPEWLSIVEQDIDACDLALVVVTPLSREDDSVAARLRLAREMNVPLLPVTLADHPENPGEDRPFLPVL